jgi:HEAT repeat protein
VSGDRRFNEEEIKVKFILPVLKAIGLETVDDLFFEQYVRDPESGDRGFADIIVRRADKAILVIELKASEVNVRSVRVIQQAITYARQHKTIIPFALVSNGRDLVLIDVLLGELIERSGHHLDAAGRLLSEVDAELKRQALQTLGFINSDILQNLADSQRGREIALLAGAETPAAKIVDRRYISDLYVPRRQLAAAFGRFLASEAQVFAVVGDAGMGKTNFLCQSAEQLGKTAPVLFYLGAELATGLKPALLADLNIILPNVSFDKAIQRISEASRDDGRTIFVFIDALNECASQRETLRAELNDIARLTAGAPWRFVVSCRTLDWDFWMRNENNMVGRFGRSSFSDSGQQAGGAVSAVEFDAEEFVEAWKKYRDAFALQGTLSARMETLCHEPFMLRLVAELYRGGKPIPDHIEPLTLFERYFTEKFPTDSSRLPANRFLLWMARRIMAESLPRVHVADLSAEDIGICRRLLDEKVIISRRGLYLYFHFELFLEFVVSLWILSEIPEEFTSDEKLGALLRAADNRLINMPGIIENILLSWQTEPTLVSAALERLAERDDRWKAIVCSTIRKLEKPVAELSDTIAALARDSNYVIRQFVAQAISRYLRVTGWTPVLRLINERKSWEARETAANIIGRNIGALGAEAVPKLWFLADDFHWRVRRAAGYALRDCWKTENRAEIESHKVRFVSEVSAATWRQKYSLCIALLGTDLAVPSLETSAIKAMMIDKNHQVRWSVANYLPRYGIIGSEDLLESLACDVDAWVRTRMAGSLITIVKQGELEAARKWLIALAGDPSENVRLKLARDLAAISDRSWARDILVRYLGDADEIAFAAAYTMDTGASAKNMGIVHVDRWKGGDASVRVLRERIVRQDLNPATTKFSAIQEYISRRTEFRPENDSYMRVIDTMCSLIVSATAAMKVNIESEEKLFDLLIHDRDETVRWALVLFLAEYGLDRCDHALRFRLFARLAADAHWWVRREVAIALGRLNEETGRRDAFDILSRMRQAEQVHNEPCADEVLHYVGEALESVSAQSRAAQ